MDTSNVVMASSVMKNFTSLQQREIRIKSQKIWQGNPINFIGKPAICKNCNGKATYDENYRFKCLRELKVTAEVVNVQNDEFPLKAFVNHLTAANNPFTYKTAVDSSRKRRDTDINTILWANPSDFALFRTDHSEPTIISVRPVKGITLRKRIYQDWDQSRWEEFRDMYVMFQSNGHYMNCQMSKHVQGLQEALEDAKSRGDHKTFTYPTAIAH